MPSSTRATVGEQARATKVRQATQKIRRFHALGARSLARCPGRMWYGETDDHARRCGTSAEMLRKARSFANSYTGEQAKALCLLCERRGAAYSVSHVFRLLAVPRPHRAAFQREAITCVWSKGRIDAEIRKRFGNRRPAAGRRRLPPPTADDACYQIVQLCDQWRRLHREITEPSRHGKDQEFRALDSLPTRTRSALSVANEAMRQLRDKAAKQLSAAPADLPADGGSDLLAPRGTQSPRRKPHSRVS